MRERITPSGDEFPEVSIQWDKDRGPVGIGVEPRSEIPSAHFIDAMYGGVPSQTAIGKLFFEKRRQDFQEHMDFQDRDSEAEFYNTLGRDILDSVTGSSSMNGIWTWLERPAVNRMIRILRKARDESFGRDE